MTGIVPTPEPDDYARGWAAAVQRVGDLMVTVENDTHRGVINALYLRLVNDGVPAHHEPVDGRIVAMGVLALEAFSDDLNRSDAATLLTMWAHYPRLWSAEVEAILAGFPEPGPQPQPGGGWISGPSIGGPHTGGADQ